jgi:hypothetical protein
MELQTKKKIICRLVRPQKNGQFRNDNRCNIASYEKNTKYLLKFFRTKKILNFPYTIYSFSFNRKFAERGKIPRKKNLTNIFPCYFSIRKLLFFSFKILSRSTKNKNCFPLKLKE